MEPSAKITRSIHSDEITRNWWVIDATGKTVGRLASQIAVLLRGKHKPWFTPHVDCGDYVIITNAEKIEFTGERIEKKEYFHYTGYPGGAKFEKAKEIMKNRPEFVIENAVRGMIPKNRLGRKIIKKLKVYAGSEHPHSAQKPNIYELKYNN